MSRTRTSAGTSSKLRAAGTATALLLLAGCGAPGDPLPPLLNIPERTTDFAAHQQGADLVLAWTLPNRTTEATAVTDLSRVVVVAAEVDSDSAGGEVFAGGNRELVVLEKPTAGERIERRLPLPGPAGRRVALAVRNESRRGRTAGYSNVVVVAIVEPLGAPANLRATPSPAGIRLEWNPVPSATAYRIFRRRGTQPELAPLANVERGPFVDADFEWGTEAAYRVRALAGTAESPDSAVIAVTPVDSFPPSAPEALRAVVGEGVVELSWSPSPESDTAGYNVYRSEAGGMPERLNSRLLATPAFSDRPVPRGAQYAYNVSAVDEKGNESPRSAPAEVTIP